MKELVSFRLFIERRNAWTKHELQHRMKIDFKNERLKWIFPHSSFSTIPNDSSSESFPYICWNLEIYWRKFNSEQWTLSLVKVYIPRSRPNIFIFHRKSMIRKENSMIPAAVRLTTRLFRFIFNSAKHCVWIRNGIFGKASCVVVGLSSSAKMSIFLLLLNSFPKYAHWNRMMCFPI